MVSELFASHLFFVLTVTDELKKKKALADVLFQILIDKEVAGLNVNRACETFRHQFSTVTKEIKSFKWNEAPICLRSPVRDTCDDASNSVKLKITGETRDAVPPPAPRRASLFNAEVLAPPDMAYSYHVFRSGCCESSEYDNL